MESVQSMSYGKLSETMRKRLADDVGPEISVSTLYIVEDVSLRLQRIDYETKD